MGTQIADSVEHDLRGLDGDLSERERQMRNRHENQAATMSGTNDFLSDLLDGQQKLISAQYQFLRDGDQARLLAAQSEMVQCQMMVLNRLGVFG